jgi:hypothetical protein
MTDIRARSTRIEKGTDPEATILLTDITNKIIARVNAGVPTKFSAEHDPRYQIKYLTPQEKLEEYKKEHPEMDTTVHNKTDRQLYIGNLPPDITIPELCKHLNDAMYALNL